MVPAPPLPASSTRPPPLRVLVVEDEALLRWAISESLTAAGHQVLQAADGASAMAAVADGVSALDVILLDFRLPDSDDFGLLTRLQALSPGSAVVMMTACNTPELSGTARALGAAVVLDKPFDLQTLDAHLRAACSGGAT